MKKLFLLCLLCSQSVLAQTTPTQSNSFLQRLNPDISAVLDIAGAYFSVDEPNQTGAHDPTQTGFNLQQFELQISSVVDPYLRFDSNIVLNLDSIEIEEAYGTTLNLPYNFQVRAGQFLTRFGRLNSTHPHSWSFIDQPLVNGNFLSSEGNRGLGVEASVLAPLPWYVEIVTSANKIQFLGGEGHDHEHEHAEEDDHASLENMGYTLAVKQFFPINDDWSILWGLSGQIVPQPASESQLTQLYGTDLYVRFRPSEGTTFRSISWQTEAMMRTQKIAGQNEHDFGAYSQIVWQLNQRFDVGVRSDYISRIEDESARNRHAVQTSFYPSHFSRLRLQMSYEPAVNKQRDPIFATMLGLELVTGAHGSHDY